MFEIIESIENESAVLCDLLELVKIIEHNHKHIIPKEESQVRSAYVHDLIRNNQTDGALARTLSEGLERYMKKINDLISRAYETK